MIKALFFDIDGTLVSFKTHEVPRSAVEAIAAAVTRGVKVFIATGRPMAIINNLRPLQEAGLISGYVTMNGAYCFTQGDIIHERPIDKQDVLNVAEICQREHLTGIFVSEHQMHVVNGNDLLRKIFVTNLGVDPNALPSDTMEGVLRQTIYQITPFFTAEQEELSRHLFPHCEVNRWHPAFVDLTQRGTTKREGIARICDYYGLRPEECMSFGDGGNDVSMLHYCGIGVAMGNATDIAKEAADYVTTSVDDDGVKQALRQFGVI